MTTHERVHNYDFKIRRIRLGCALFLRHNNNEPFFMTAAAAPLTRGDQLNIFTVSMGHGITHWLHIVPTVLLLVVKDEFGLDYTDVGLYGSVYAAAATVTNLAGGPLTDLIGRRERFMLASLVIMAVSMVALYFSVDFWTFLAAAVLVSIGNHLWHPAAIPYLASRYEERRGYALSIHSLFSNLGDSAAPTVVGGMIAGWYFLTFSWRETALLNALPVLLLLPAFIIIVMPRRTKENRNQKEGMNFGDYIHGIWGQLKNKAVLGLALMAGFRSTAQHSLRLFFPFYIAEVLTDLTVAEAAGFAGLALTALNLGGSFAAIPAGIASDRYGRRPIVMWALALSTVFIFSLSLLRDELSLVIGISLVGFSIYALRPVMVGWMMDIVPREFRGSCTNLMFTTQSAMQMVSPLIAGAIADVYGVVYVFYFAAGLLLLANTVAFMLPKK